MAQRFELVVSEIPKMPIVEFNYEELKAAATEVRDKAGKLLYTEDQRAQLRADKAMINKAKKMLADERIALKKQYLEPFNDFETKAKEIEGLLGGAYEAINAQEIEFDNREKEQKMVQINALYDANIGKYKQLIPLDKIFDDKWLNKTFKLKDIENIIKATSMTADLHLREINELNSEFTEQLKNKYFETLDMQAVLAEKTLLEQRKKALEELEKRKKAEELAKDVPVEKEPEQMNIFEPVDMVGVVKKEEPQLITIAFKVRGTKEQLNGLVEYMKRNDIAYGRA